MVLSFFEHAVERMQSRAISVEIVHAILKQPEGKIRQSADKWILYKKIRGRNDNMVAVVVVFKNDRPVEIVTVMNYFEVLA